MLIEHVSLFELEGTRVPSRIAKPLLTWCIDEVGGRR